MKHTVIFLFSLSIFIGANLEAQPTDQNVLLIIADDIGVEKLQAYKGDLQHTHTVASTPTIDDLAEDGVRFTQAWANPTCSPTRAAIERMDVKTQ